MKKNKVVLIGFAQATVMHDIRGYAEADGNEVEYMHPDVFLSQGSDPDALHMCAITLDLNLRQEVIKKLQNDRYQCYTYIHPTAEIANDSVIGQGTFIGPFVMIGSRCVVGEHCNFGPYSTICHKSTLGEGSILFVAAIIAGTSQVGKHCRLSLRSTIIDHVSVCDYVEIGSGALVTKDITETGKYLGSPARKIPTPYACRVPPARLQGKENQ